jgi:hypothetical protein
VRYTDRCVRMSGALDGSSEHRTLSVVKLRRSVLVLVKKGGAAGTLLGDTAWHDGGGGWTLVFVVCMLL